MSNVQRPEQHGNPNADRHSGRHRTGLALGASALVLLLTTACNPKDILGTPPVNPDYKSLTVTELSGQIAKKCPVNEYVKLGNLSLGQLDLSHEDKEGFFYAATPHGKIAPTVTIETSADFELSAGNAGTYDVTGQVKQLDKAPSGGIACVVVGSIGTINVK